MFLFLRGALATEFCPSINIHHHQIAHESGMVCKGGPTVEECCCLTPFFHSSAQDGGYNQACHLHFQQTLGVLNAVFLTGVWCFLEIGGFMRLTPEIRQPGSTPAGASVWVTPRAITDTARNICNYTLVPADRLGKPPPSPRDGGWSSWLHALWGAARRHALPTALRRRKKSACGEGPQRTPLQQSEVRWQRGRAM